MKKLILPIVLSSSLTVAGLVPIPFNIQASVVEAASSFKDIPSDYHALKQIDYLVSKGVISGFEDGTFKPNQVVTRGQFAAFVARALDLKTSNITFKDVKSGNSLYTEINKGATAGIIKGYKDGTFRPDLPVTRSDIAVMLDRALQLKGTYTKTASLPYSDAGSIGGYALESVKRMAAYGIMGAIENTNKFQPSTSGTRVETVVSIFNMLQTFQTNSPSIPNKKDSELTIAELTLKYGEQKIIARSRADQTFYEQNIIEHYHKYYKDFDDNFLDYKKMLKDSFYSQYDLYYPYVELISYNGKAYKSSEFYVKDLRFVDDEILPTNPVSSSYYSIDIFLNSKNSATYLKEKVLTKQMENLPYKVNGDVMVELETLIKDHINISVSSTKLIVKSGKVLEFTVDSNKVLVDGQSVQLKTPVKRVNGKFMIPLRETAELMGLHTRTFTGLDVNKPTDLTRIELANFPLPADYTK